MSDKRLEALRARTDVPLTMSCFASKDALLKEALERANGIPHLLSLLAEAREALGFYAEPSNWQDMELADVGDDYEAIRPKRNGIQVITGGKRARAALDRLGGR